MMVISSRLHGIPNRWLALMVVLLTGIGFETSAKAVIRDAKPVAGDEKVVNFITAARDGDVAAVKALLENGLDVNSKDAIGDTALSWAAYAGKLEVVKLLIEKGADINVKNTGTRFGAGYTPLMYAAAGGQLEMVKYLYEKTDAKLKEDASYGGVKVSGLRAAGISGKVEAMQFFIDQGADVNAKSSNGGTLLMGTTVSLNPAVTKLLLNNGADLTPKTIPEGRTALHEAACRNLQMTQYLLEKGADINVRLPSGETLLSMIARGHVDNRVFPYLLSKGAPIDLEAKEFGGLPTLIGFIFNGLNEQAELLLEKGSDVNVKDGAGRTPLMLAVRAGNTEGVKLLIAKGADVNATANNGDTALKLAANQQVIADLLREKGAKE